MKKTLILLAIAVALCGCSKIELQTDTMRMKIDRHGFVTSWTECAGGKEYFPKGAKAPLMALYKDSVYIMPVRASYNGDMLSLEYENGSEAVVRIEPKESYFRIELLSVEPRNGVEGIQWGPLPTTLDKHIGETVGVVRGDDFAIGVLALNTFTVEGTPTMRSHKHGRMVIDPLPGQALPDSLRNSIGEEVLVDVNQTGDLPPYVRIYRGNAARKTALGSELLFHALDRRIARVAGDKERLHVIEAVEWDFTGSAIALFGCAQSQTLDVIERIELSENLPHPVIDGHWVKRSPRLGEAYLMYTGQSQQNALKYAEMFGFKLIHIGDIFESWGHFGLETERFPRGAADIRLYADKVREQGVALGVHTLTMFTSVNDPYVSPVPSDSLCKTGSSILSRLLAAADDVIYIEDPAYFRNTGNTNTVKIGKELIGYGRLVEEQPYRLENCVRGQFGTRIAAHEAGAAVDKLTNNSYRGFYPDFNLQYAYADRLAQVCNQTGVDLMDFDGFDINPTGHDAFADAEFIDRWYRQLDRARMVCGSQPSHYYWHIFTFMNWGEPWYNALRQSQVNYRIENQRFFERNLMPGMLGWFSMREDYRVEDIEWIQARSAAFDAGYLLRLDDKIERNGFIDQIALCVREWQKARRAGAFPEELIEQMKDPKREYHLEAVGGGSGESGRSGESRGSGEGRAAWNIYPVDYVQGALEHKDRSSQPGEPAASECVYNNPFDDQNARFYITVQGEQSSSTVSQLLIQIDMQIIEVKETLTAGRRIYCDGQNIYLCDANWKQIKRLEAAGIPRWQKGANRVRVSGKFRGNIPPAISFDFKAIGPPQRIGN